MAVALRAVPATAAVGCCSAAQATVCTPPQAASARPRRTPSQQTAGLQFPMLLALMNSRPRGVRAPEQSPVSCDASLSARAHSGERCTLHWNVGRCGSSYEDRTAVAVARSRRTGHRHCDSLDAQTWVNSGSTKVCCEPKRPRAAYKACGLRCGRQSCSADSALSDGR